MIKFIHTFLVAAIFLMPLGVGALEKSNFNCGTWGERTCEQLEWEDLHGGIDRCDRGLDCRGTGFLGACRRGTDKCFNGGRWSETGREFRTSWVKQAIDQQREVSRFEPLSWTMILGSHNAFNNKADGYLVENQKYSMTDQMRMGARALMLDVIKSGGELRLSHATAWRFDRHLAFGVIEINQWLDRQLDDGTSNQGEVIVLQIEHNIADDPGAVADFRWIMDTYLGPKILRRNVWPIFDDGKGRPERWPTLSEMRRMGKQVIITGGKLADQIEYVYKGVTSSPTPNKFDYTDCWLDSSGQKNDSYLYDGRMSVLLGIEEERLPDLVDGYIAESCPAVLPGEDPFECRTVREITECGNTEIVLDFIGSTNSRGTPPMPTGDRFTDLVWSWKEGHSGWMSDNHGATLEFSGGRWVSRPLEEKHHFACGNFREGEPIDWEDVREGRNQLTEWKVSNQTGTFDQGGSICTSEFGDYPESSLVFSVPVNAPQNADLHSALREAMNDPEFDPTSTDVWLAYKDIDPEAGSVEWDRRVPCIYGIQLSPRTLWPPNHKMIEVDIELQHHCPRTPYCQIVDVSSNDPAFSPDDVHIDSEYPLRPLLRAERSGQMKSGRNYKMELDCVVNQEGRIDEVVATIAVEHDARK